MREKAAGGKKYGASPVSHDDVGSPIGTRLLYLHTVGPWLPNSGLMVRYWKSHKSTGTIEMLVIFITVYFGYKQVTQ
jgi:hypothetical protein